MILDDYRVRLEAFEGPLDLLLFLIRKSEVDVHDIPIATITDQYLAFLGQLRSRGPGRIDIDTAGEFLVMAATLMEIKSRMLLPRPPAVTREQERGPAEDPRAELVRQLLEYKKYRDAAEALEGRAEEWRRRFAVSGVDVSAEAVKAASEAASDGLDLEDLDLMDLVEAFKRIAETVNFDRLGDHQVTYDDTPIEVHAQDILTQIRHDDSAPREVEFTSFFVGRQRHEMLGLFLALLELVRKRLVGVRQDRVDGQIYLRAREEEPAQADPAHPEATPAAPSPEDQ